MKITAYTGEAGKVVQDPSVRAIIMQEIRNAAPILDLIEFYTYIGSRRDAPALPPDRSENGVGSRAIGFDYTQDPEHRKPKYGDMIMKTIGGVVDMDQAFERSNPGGTGSEYLRQMIEYAQMVGRYLQNLTINGNSDETTGNPLDFDGMASLVKSEYEYTFDTANGGIVSTGNTSVDRKQQDKFLEALDELCENNPSCLVMHRRTRARMKTISRDRMSSVDFTTPLGTVKKMDIYEGIPIIDAGRKAKYSEYVITQTETCGTSTDCTSIWAPRFGEKKDFAFATNVGFQVGSKSEKNVVASRIEADMGTALLKDDAISVLHGLRIVGQ